MAERRTIADLTGWKAYEPDAARKLRYPCLTRGDGPGVILLHEFPGITATAIAFGNHLVDQRFTVVMPSLVGDPREPRSRMRDTKMAARLCMMGEFKAFALNADGEITTFLRDLATELTERTPGRGVGIIGMCFTGGFALAATVGSAELLATVVSQPSIPVAISPARRRSVGVPAQGLRELADSPRGDGACVLGLRFSRDVISPEARFTSLRRHLGGAFEVFPLYSGADCTDGTSRFAHSVLTGEMREDPRNQEFNAREYAVEFLRRRLAPTPGAPAGPGL